MADDKPKTVAELKAVPKVTKDTEKGDPLVDNSLTGLAARVAALEEEIKKCVHAHS